MSYKGSNVYLEYGCFACVSNSVNMNESFLRSLIRLLCTGILTSWTDWYLAMEQSPWSKYSPITRIIKNYLASPYGCVDSVLFVAFVEFPKPAFNWYFVASIRRYTALLRYSQRMKYLIHKTDGIFDTIKDWHLWITILFLR